MGGRSWTNHTMLGRRGHTAPSGFVSLPENTLSIVRVDHLGDHLPINRLEDGTMTDW